MRYKGYLSLTLLWGAALVLGFLFFKKGAFNFLSLTFTHHHSEHFTLPLLTYDYNALEPAIDEQTVKIHHTQHHQKYVEKLNIVVDEYPALSNKPLKEWLSNLGTLPATIRTGVRNFGGGHYNHSFYWNCMTPHASGAPQGEIATAITKAFGSLDAFKEKFEQEAAGVFGSGWTWLCMNKSGNLVIMSTSNQDTPLAQELEPLLVIDLWEHAYYLKYQSNRLAHIKAWWNLINWDEVEKQYQAAHTTFLKETQGT